MVEDIIGKVRIGNYDVSKDDVWLYIQHFGRDKSDLWEWERHRKVFHDNIFFQLGIERLSDEGIKFGEALDEYCEPYIMKYDPVISTAKTLMRAKTKEEIEIATKRLEIESYKQDKMLLYGFRGLKVTDENICRICGKKSLGGRVNDHLAIVEGFNEINKPICVDCSKNNPDDYHIAFKEQYWSK